MGVCCSREIVHTEKRGYRRVNSFSRGLSRHSACLVQGVTAAASWVFPDNPVSEGKGHGGHYLSGCASSVNVDGLLGEAAAATILLGAWK